MEEPEDRKLDALLRIAAPDGAPPGFADRVVLATRARRRARWLRRAAVAVAAVVAIAAGVGLYGVYPWAGGPEAVRLDPAVVPVGNGDEQGADEPQPSFAVQLPSTGEARHRVMIAHVDGKVTIVARPNDETADEAAGGPRRPVAMVGFVSADAPEEELPF